MTMTEGERLRIAEDEPTTTPGILNEHEVAALRHAIESDHVIGTVALLLRKHVKTALDPEVRCGACGEMKPRVRPGGGPIRHLVAVRWPVTSMRYADFDYCIGGEPIDMRGVLVP